MMPHKICVSYYQFQGIVSRRCGQLSGIQELWWCPKNMRDRKSSWVDENVWRVAYKRTNLRVIQLFLFHQVGIISSEVAIHPCMLTKILDNVFLTPLRALWSMELWREIHHLHTFAWSILKISASINVSAFISICLIFSSISSVVVFQLYSNDSKSSWGFFCFVFVY